MRTRPFTDHSFAEFLAEEKLMSSRCRTCGALFTPQRALCVHCYATAMEWLELKGSGRLLAFTCIHIGARFMLAEGFDRQHPYCVGVVELDEGTRVNARIIGVDANQPEMIRVGVRLQASYVHSRDGEGGKTHLAFAPI